ncbi:MAG: RNA polymerase sigma factor [Deltaproteobacteria bacterium]|nr:RNA polymerase sigma factor [Deltaproteobacteria bacterium]
MIASPVPQPSILKALSENVRVDLDHCAHYPSTAVLSPPRHLQLVPAAPQDCEAVPTDAGDAFRQYGRYVATIAFRIMGRRDELEDLVQDVFLEVHRTLPTLRSAEALRGWLATITVRTARHRLRRRRLKSFFGLTETLDEHDLADPNASAETGALLAPVFAALDTLPVPVRIAWVLRHLEGHPLERVAQLSGCSLAAVKRRLVKANAVMDEVVADV